MDNFNAFALPESLQKSLTRLNMSKPTDVQIQAIPHAMAGKDVIVSAPTGTGKTLAFSIPIVAKLIEDKNFGVIVITPTRELAAQIITVMQSLLFFNREVKSALLIGGAPMGPQLAQLRNKPQLIVGTPGRINDHLDTGRLTLEKTKFVVLDEMDRMLDMGFSVQIDEVLTYLKNEKQAMMLSATISPAIRKLSARYLNDPASVTIDGKDIVNTKIKQEFIHLAREHKYEELVKQLTEREGSVIIFVKTRRNAEDIADRLYNDNFRARSIHGDLRQNQRDKIIRLFRKGDFEIIVGTDVASRGLDVPHIKHVINYNLPTNPEDYVHRVGRTARAGAEGDALTFVSSNERKEWNALEVFLDPSKKSKAGNDNNKGRPKRKFGSRDGRGGAGRFQSDRRSNSSSRGDSSRGGYRGDSSRGDNRSESRGGYRGDSSRGDNRSESRGGYRGDSSRGDNRSESAGRYKGGDRSEFSSLRGTRRPDSSAPRSGDRRPSRTAPPRNKTRDPRDPREPKVA